MKTIATVVRATTICIAAILGYNASAGSLSNDQSPADAPLKYLVRFPNLDLSRIEGATALYARLRQAAHVVCKPLESRELARAVKYRACVDKAIADAVASVNSPLLSHYYQLQSRTPGPVRLAKAN